MADWSFDRLECTAERLPALVGELADEWVGLAVTMPGKAAAAAFAAGRSARVDALGVANTLIRRPDGWFADNTDVDGVRGSLTAAGVRPSGPVLLLGGGGTARAVVAALAELTWDGPLVLAGRRPQSTAAAAALAASLGLETQQTGMTSSEVALAAREAGLVISTVPTGVADDLADALARVPALLDVIYDPWPTPLAAAGSASRITITGLDMLLHQALTQFALVTGVGAPAEAMRRALRVATGSDLALPV